MPILLVVGFIHAFRGIFMLANALLDVFFIIPGLAIILGGAAFIAGVDFVPGYHPVGGVLWAKIHGGLW